MYRSIFQYPLFALFLTLSFNVWSDASVHKCKNQLGEFVYQKEPCSDDTQALETPIRTKASKAKSPIIIEQGIGGDFHLDIEMNEISVKFVLDTGAAMVSLPSAIAKSADVGFSI
jgi:predicted aspartyl protease